MVNERTLDFCSNFSPKGGGGQKFKTVTCKIRMKACGIAIMPFLLCVIFAGQHNSIPVARQLHLFRRGMSMTSQLTLEALGSLYESVTDGSLETKGAAGDPLVSFIRVGDAVMAIHADVALWVFGVWELETAVVSPPPVSQPAMEDGEAPAVARAPSAPKDDVVDFSLHLQQRVRPIWSGVSPAVSTTAFADISAREFADVAGAPSQLTTVTLPLEHMPVREDGHHVLPFLVHVVYNGGRFPRDAPEHIICAVLALLVASGHPANARALIEVALTAVGETFGSRLSHRWTLAMTCEPVVFPTPPALKYNLLKHAASAEIQRVWGWKCVTCLTRSPHETKVCVGCGRPSDAESQHVALPTDLDLDFFNPPPGELRAFDALTAQQRAAVKHVVQHAQRASSEQMEPLSNRLRGLGYTPADMVACLRYIRDDAPLIIHISIARIKEALRTDTHYRSQFEVLATGGSSYRVDKEDAMFNKAYSGVPPFERCKYGALNVTNDPHGLHACAAYGESYLILKNCRLRATFADSNSSRNSSLATCESYCHVLNKYSDAELEAVMDVATGKAPWRSSTVVSVYKEFQLHGELRFADHIQTIVVHPKFQEDETVTPILCDFSSRFGVPMVWMVETPEEELRRRAAATHEAVRLEASAWQCWGCGNKTQPDRPSCAFCAMSKPTPKPDPKWEWGCPACAARNANTNNTCHACGKGPAPSWKCACGALHPSCNVQCGVCITPRQDPLPPLPPWVCNGACVRSGVPLPCFPMSTGFLSLRMAAPNHVLPHVQVAQ